MKYAQVALTGTLLADLEGEDEATIDWLEGQPLKSDSDYDYMIKLPKTEKEFGEFLDDAANHSVHQRVLDALTEAFKAGCAFVHISVDAE